MRSFLKIKSLFNEKVSSIKIIIIITCIHLVLVALRVIRFCLAQDRISDARIFKFTAVSDTFLPVESSVVSSANIVIPEDGLAIILMKVDVYLWLPLYVALFFQREALDPLLFQDGSVRYLGSTYLCLSNVLAVSCSENPQFLVSSRQLLEEFNRFAEFNISLPLLDVQLRNDINVAEPQRNVSSGNVLLSHHCDTKQRPNITNKFELSYDHKRSKVKCKWSASRLLY